MTERNGLLRELAWSAVLLAGLACAAACGKYGPPRRVPPQPGPATAERPATPGAPAAEAKEKP